MKSKIVMNWSFQGFQQIIQKKWKTLKNVENRMLKIFKNVEINLDMSLEWRYGRFCIVSKGIDLTTVRINVRFIQN